MSQNKASVDCFVRCSAQHRQDIIGNRRKSARARREIFGSGVKSRIVGAVVQKVKKKSAWTICWRLNRHTQQDFSHQNNKGGLGSGSVSLTMLTMYPSTNFALEIMTFLLCCPLVGFLCNTDGYKMVKGCRVFVSTAVPRRRRGSKVSTPVRHFVIFKVTLLLCCG